MSNIWTRLQERHERTGERSEAPESGDLNPGELELFPRERELEKGPEHPGQLPPHYRMDVQHPGHISGYPPRPHPVPAMPKGNRFYDSFRSQQIVANQTIEYMASGSIGAPAGGASTGISITNINPSIRLRLLELPWTVQAHIILRRFCASPTTTADTGVITWTYVDVGGIQAILSARPGNTWANEDCSLLMPTPLTDPTPANLGQLQISASAGGTFAATWLWYLHFSFLYLRPGDLTR